MGGLRWWGFSRHLARRGWRIHLVTAERGASSEALPPRMTVERLPARTTLDDRYRDWRRRRRRPGGRGREPGRTPVGPRGATDDGPVLSLRGLRREVGGLLSFPDEGRGWIVRAAAAARRRLRTWQPSVVVSTGPPHSTHLAVGLASRGLEVPWLADFRDPWSDWPGVAGGVRWVRPVLRRLESAVIRSSGHALTTTEELARVLEERYPAFRVEWLPNGVDGESLPHRAAPASPAFTVVHVGTLYHRRDPAPVVRAFARFVRMNEAGSEPGVALRFVGAAVPGARQRLEAVVREEGMEGRVELTGPIPRAEALGVVARASLAVVLAQAQPTQVPAKIYESAAMGVPTLVVSEPDSATGVAGTRLGAAVHAPDDVPGMAAAFEAVRAGRWRGGVPDGVRLDYADLVDDVEEILTRTAHPHVLPAGEGGVPSRAQEA